MALHVHSDDGAAFQNGHITAGLDPAPPCLIDLVILEADVTSALAALRRLCIGNHFEFALAVVAFDRPLLWRFYEKSAKKSW